MTPRLILIAVAAVAIVVIGGAWISNRHQSAREAAYEQQARELKGQADAFKAQADQHKALADTLASTVAQQDKTVSALKAKLAAIRPSSPTAPALPGVPNTVAPIGDDPTVIRDQIIAAQDTEITGLKSEVLELRASLSLTQAALDASEKRARGLEIALDAQKSAAKSGKWIGRFQGALIGFGAGYVAGRLH